MQSTNCKFKFVIRTYDDNMFYYLLHILLPSTIYDLNTFASGMIYDSEMKRSEVTKKTYTKVWQLQTLVLLLPIIFYKLN